ncbi:MAG: hypothetical protein V4750_01660 [Pseudomonadota bacterium]
MSEAIDRIETSRARLKLAMSPPPPAADQRTRAPAQPWLHRLTDLPLVSAVIESVTAWWSHHPLRPVAQVANEASSAVVRPLAQRNPLTLVLVAGVIGAGLAWTRPWRWIFRSALFAGLVPQLASRVVSSLPIESWMTMAGASMARQQPASRAGRAAAPTA